MAKNPNWTKEEEEIFKKYYPTDICMEELLDLLPNRNEVALRNRAKILGLKKGKYIPKSKKFIADKRWTTEELEIFKENYHAKTYDELVSMLSGRTLRSIKKRAVILNLPPKERISPNPQTQIPWSSIEEGLLIKCYHLSTNAELMELIPERTYAAIREKARKLGLKRPKNIWRDKGLYSPWHDDEVKILLENYKDKSIEQLTQLLPHRTKGGIRDKLKVLV